MNILKYFDLVWFKNIFMQIINLRLMSLGRLSRGFPTWCVISILSMENDTLSGELFLKYRTLLHWCFIFFFSTTPVILKQFGLEHFSWSSSWLSNESTCCWRDGNFFKLDIRDLLLKWFMIEYDRDCFLSGIIIFWERFL